MSPLKWFVVTVGRTSRYNQGWASLGFTATQLLNLCIQSHPNMSSQISLMSTHSPSPSPPLTRSAAQLFGFRVQHLYCGRLYRSVHSLSDVCLGNTYLESI